MTNGSRIIIVFFAFLLATSFWAPPARSQGDVEGKTFYTAANIWYEKPDKILSTNYHRGTILPVGTKVTVTEVRGKKIRFIDARGVGFAIEFVKKHSSAEIDLWAYFGRYFSTKNPLGKGTPYQGFSEKEKRNIKSGEIAVGMSKEAVLMAYGYPPAHRTPSLEADQWVYWISRFINRPVVFHNGRVSQWQ
jgi:hypothetical protein